MSYIIGICKLPPGVLLFTIMANILILTDTTTRTRQKLSLHIPKTSSTSANTTKKTTKPQDKPSATAAQSSLKTSQPSSEDQALDRSSQKPRKGHQTTNSKRFTPESTLTTPASQALP
jgi:hypothetical protein